jgi:hypothetical protein
MELPSQYAPETIRSTLAKSLFFDSGRGTIGLLSPSVPAQGAMQRTRYPERRRTTRLSLQIPLTVRCCLPEGETIDLKASTYIVSADGALLLMDTPLFSGQPVKVINEYTAKSIDCVVTSLREKRERRFVGVAFANPDVDFWHIVFPKSGTRQAIRSSQTGALMPPGIRSNTSEQF